MFSVYNLYGLSKFLKNLVFRILELCEASKNNVTYALTLPLGRSDITFSFGYWYPLNKTSVNGGTK